MPELTGQTGRDIFCLNSAPDWSPDKEDLMMPAFSGAGLTNPVSTKPPRPILNKVEHKSTNRGK